MILIKSGSLDEVLVCFKIFFDLPESLKANLTLI